ncbi:MAG: TerB family tellurite resistance protein [Paracoccaceae bacterium]
MLKSLLSLLADPAPGHSPPPTRSLPRGPAGAAGPCRRALRRGGKDRIEQVLARRGGLGHAQAATAPGGQAVEADAPDTVRFTRALKDKIAHEDRIGVIEALWEVALADDARDAEEDALIRLAANLLGVNDRDSALARQRVIAERG